MLPQIVAQNPQLRLNVGILENPTRIPTPTPSPAMLTKCSVAIVLVLFIPALAVAEPITNWSFIDGVTAGQTINNVSQAGGANLTTVLINGTTGGGHELGGNGGKVGVNTGGSETGNNATSWSDGESWTFQWSEATTFSGIDFNNLTALTQSFTVQSDAFKGRSLSTGAGVAYDATAGSFNFTNVSSDSFGIAELGGTLVVGAATDVTISYAGTASADLGAMNFSAVPEPSGMSVACLAMLTFTLQRRRRS